MLAVYLVIVGGLAVVVAYLSARLDELPISEPLAAMLVGVVFGPVGFDVIHLPEEPRPLLHDVTQVLLAITLMTIALRYRSGDVRRRTRPVVLLLVVALPLMTLVPTGLAAVVLGLGWVEALVLGAALAPTDPVLASSVVTGHPAEERLPARLRQVLSLEAGWNDGLALPFVLIGVTLVTSRTGSWWALHGLGGVVGALVFGAGSGIAAARALMRVRRRQYQHASTFPLFTITFSLLVLGLAEWLQLDGILAVFAAGISYNLGIGEEEREPQHRIEEGIDRVMALPVFTFFGIALPIDAWLDLDWTVIAFVVGVLVLRRLPVVLLLRRPLGLTTTDAVWLGWFGPVGVAALLYLTLAHELHASTPTVWAAGTAVIAASTAAHGLTTRIGRRGYQRFAMVDDEAGPADDTHPLQGWPPPGPAVTSNRPPRGEGREPNPD